MFDPDDYVGARGLWVTQCGDPGPYAINRPTPKMLRRLEVLRCNLAAGHPTPFHCYCEPDRGTIARWKRDGTPDFPREIKPTAAVTTQEV